MSENELGTVGGEVRSLALDSLRPDWRNPRFPSKADEAFENDNDVYRFIESNFDAISVADSISRHGFFASEPLIAIPDKDGFFVVLEGNRRLTALRGLADSDLRQSFKDARWISLASRISLQDEVPVLIASSREQVAPILGYRHVTGITPWDPFQQARYVADLIDDPDGGLSASEVAERIGRDVSEVRAFYRNYSLVEQARDDFGIDDADRLVDEFGVWNRALTTTGIRSYIGAPAPRFVVEGQYPLDADKSTALSNVITWVFGEPRSEDERQDGQQSKSGRLISDSRELTRLGRVLANDDGREALEAGADLDAAEDAMVDITQRFTSALLTAKRALERAQKGTPPEVETEHVTLLEEIVSAASGMMK